MVASDEGSISVLLVDDNADIAAVTSQHLERLESAFDVTVEHDADAGFEYLAEDVDCVVSDFEMPGKDGLEFLREVRERYPEMPFILFTGRGSEEIASEAISAGVTDYLQKDAGLEQYTVLANRIENAVERRRSQAVAAETEGRYRSLVESSPHAILVHDGDAIIYANDRLAELLRADAPGDVYDAAPAEFVHPDDRGAVAERVERVLADREAQGWFEYRIERFDGETRWVESRAAPVRYEGRPASQAVVRDVTERREREHRLEALHEATRRLLTVRDRDGVAEVAVDVLEDVFERPIGAVWRYDVGEPALVPVAATGRACTLADADGPEDLPTLTSETLEMDVFESGEPRVIGDYASREEAVTDDIETTLLFPLSDHGMLGIAAEERRTFDASEHELVGILSRAVTAALDRIAGEVPPGPSGG